MSNLKKDPDKEFDKKLDDINNNIRGIKECLSNAETLLAEVNQDVTRIERNTFFIRKINKIKTFLGINIKNR